MTDIRSECAQHFGHDKVSVLDGGLPRWQADGLPLDTTSPTNPNPHAVAEDGSALRALYCPIFSELLYAHKPKVESYFIADIEERFSDYKVEAGGEAEHKEDLRQWEDMNRIINESDKEREVIIDARAAGRCVALFDAALHSGCGSRVAAGGSRIRVSCGCGYPSSRALDMLTLR